MNKTISKTIIFGAALLILLVCNADAIGFIEFSEPVMIDTVHKYSPAGSLGSTVYTGGGIFCHGENYDLLLIETFQTSPIWAMVRIDTDGNLVDTIPTLLLPPSEKSAWNMGIYDVIWSAPYFYVVGQLYYPGVPNSSTLAYMRINENLEIIDNPPITFYKHIYSSYINLTLCSGQLWMLIEENDESYVSLYDLSADSFLIDSQFVSAGPREFYSAADLNGLYLSAKSRDTNVILNYFVDLDGNEQVLDTVAYDGIENSIFNSYSILPYRNDSIIVAYFDIDSTDQEILRYFFLNKNNPISVTAESIDVPFLPGSRTYITALFNFDGENLQAISNYQPYNQSDIGFFRFDLTAKELLFADQFTGLGIPDCFGFDNRNYNGLYYYRDHGGIYLLKFDTGDPLNTYEISQVLYNSNYYRTPSIAASGDGILIYTQYIDSASLSFKGWRISDMENFEPDSSFEFMTDNYLPYLPTLYADDEIKALFWHEDVTATNPLPATDTTFEERIVVFDSDYPIPSEMANVNLLETNKRHYDYRPDFVWLDTLLYFDILRSLSYAEYSSCAGMGLRAVNLNSGLITPLNMDYGSEGFPALVKWGDSLLSVRSYKYCTDWNNMGCTSFNMKHSFHVVYNDSVVSTGYLTSFDFYFYPPYMHVTKSEFDDRYIFGLMAIDEIWQFDSGNTTSTATVSMQPYCGQFYGYGGCDFVPIMAADYNAVFHRDSQYRILLFDKDWNFIDSAVVPLAGYPIEFSEFIYLPDDNKIVFAYSSYVADDYFSTRLFIQSVTCDIVVDVDDDPAILPMQYNLSQNYPNPFNSSTVIEYTIPVKSEVCISIYNILGRKVKNLENGQMPAGTYKIEWDGLNNSGRPVASGVYFYRIESADFIDTRKMILLK